MKVSSLENNFANLCRARDILINKRKVDNDTKKWAMQFMTPQIEEYLKISNEKALINLAENSVKAYDIALQNMVLQSKRNRGEKV